MGGPRKSRFLPADQLPPMKVLPTGIPSLDYGTGVGGFPQGSQIEIFGKASVGKTLLSCYIIAEAQRRGVPCAYLDLEGESLVKPWIDRTSKMDLSQLRRVFPDPGMDTLQALEEGLDEGFKLIFLDSLGGMVDDTEKDITSMRVGGAAKVITHMVTRLNKKIRENEAIVIYLNHAKDQMNSFGAPGQVGEYAPGGRSKENMCFMRIHLKRGEGLTNGKGSYTGFRVSADFIKNKAATPKKKVLWNLWNQPEPRTGVVGIDILQDTIDMAINYGIVQRSGAWFTHRAFGEKPLQGAEAVSNFLLENPDEMQGLKDELLDYTSNLYLTDTTNVL